MGALLDELVSKPQTLLTALSIFSTLMLGAIGIFWNVAQRKRDIKKATFDMLLRHIDSPDYMKALRRISKHVGNAGPPLPDAVDEEFKESVIVLMAHYNNLAVAASHRMLDAQVLLVSRYGSMKLVWDICAPYVATRRVQLGRPLLYAELEDYVRANAARYQAYKSRELSRRPRSGGMAEAA